MAVIITIDMTIVVTHIVIITMRSHTVAIFITIIMTVIMASLLTTIAMQKPHLCGNHTMTIIITVLTAHYLLTLMITFVISPSNCLLPVLICDPSIGRTTFTGLGEGATTFRFQDPSVSRGVFRHL